MNETYAMAVEGLAGLEKLKHIPEIIQRAASRAINATTKRTRTDAVQRMLLQVNFGAQYLSDSQGRLKISDVASPGHLESTITARHRPTSLARFTTGRSSGNGVQVAVKPGRARMMKRAFLIRLRAGAGLTETKFNMGLAIRLKPGERIENKRQMVRISSGLYLLYGPSVDQVFTKVREDVSPAAADFLETEFLRLVDLDLK